MEAAFLRPGAGKRIPLPNGRLNAFRSIDSLPVAAAESSDGRKRFAGGNGFLKRAMRIGKTSSGFRQSAPES